MSLCYIDDGDNMYNTSEYVKYFSQYTFKDSPFNEVDNALLASLAYIDFKGIVNGLNEPGLSMKLVGEHFFKKYNQATISTYSSFVQDAIGKLKMMYQANRYKDMLLSNYCYLTNHNDGQFKAICYQFERTMYVAFEGTEGTLTSWRENFELIYQFPIFSQEQAINYLNKVVGFRPLKVLVGGHSKGGNLAMAAYMYAKPYVKWHVTTVYNNDGPGFLKEQYESKAFQDLKKKLCMLIPERSLVSLVLNNADNYKVIKSEGLSGIDQHYVNNWQCYGPYFIAGKLSSSSLKTKEHIYNYFTFKNS